MLDAYYERYGLVNGERLVIPNGAYRVFLMPLYRNQERPSTPAVEIIAGPDHKDQADPILALKSARQPAASAPPSRHPRLTTQSDGSGKGWDSGVSQCGCRN